MSELERLVVLIANQLASADPEIQALVEVINARCESARDYHLTSRGIDALERVNARTGERDIDYTAARAAAAAAEN